MYKKLISRKNITSFVIASALLLIISSCKKESTTDTSISDDEVAEAVTESVSSSSGGFSTQTETAARMASTTTLTCGYSSDTSVTGQNIAGAIITYNYNLAFNRSLTCSSGLPSQFQFNFTGQSSYTALRMSSNDNSTAQFTVTGLGLAAPVYVFNQNYIRNGTQQSSVRYQRSFSSIINITSTDVTVDKITEKIISGTAEIQFIGSGSGGTTVSRGGTITFLGNGQAKLVLDNGGSYNIQL